jgi:peroxiredoxin
VGIVVWILAGMLALTLAVAWWVVYGLLRQQGRVLLRLEALERQLAGVLPASGDGRPQGFPPATALPSFRLPDLSGKPVGLEDFQGRRVLLVHWDPACGFCRQVAPELASLQEGLRRRLTELVLVSRGDPESNRGVAAEHGLACPILLQPEGPPVEAFARLGTPVAYLLDEKGRVAKPLALGAEEVTELARAAAGKKLRSERPLGESRIEREGLPAGAPAPPFSLPDLEGTTVALEDLRGKVVLVVFTDPECGPCDELAPRLAALQREHPRAEIVMVSRGEREPNRRKAADHGIEFPVVLQPGWKISKQYGIFATPVAFLVDENGVIARDVARGPDEVLALAREALVAGKEAPLAKL